jgi:transposase InsO family protein
VSANVAKQLSEIYSNYPLLNPLLSESEKQKTIDKVTKKMKPDEYMFECVVDHKGRGRKREYRVRWVGHGPEGDSWEPVKKVPELLVRHYHLWRSNKVKKADMVFESVDLSVPVTGPECPSDVDGVTPWLASLNAALVRDPFFRPILDFLRGFCTVLTSSQCACVAKICDVSGRLTYDDNRVCIPYVLVPDVIAWHHSAAYGAGHWGINRTLKSVSCRYFWPTLDEDVRTFVSKCDVCARRKRVYGHASKYTSSAFFGLPFDQVHLDFAGPFPITERGNAYVLLLVDRTTKYVCAWACKSASQEDVLSCFRDFVKTFGLPRRVYTDQGSHFTGELFTVLLEQLRVPHLVSAAYHPQANGIVERAVHSVKEQLAIMVGETGEEWDMCVDMVTYNINTTFAGAHGETPYYLVFGRDPLLPVDLLLCPDVSTADPPTHTLLAKLEERRVVLDRVLGTLNKQRQVMLDESVQKVPGGSHRFMEGDLVLLYAPLKTTPKALRLPWVGPYRITKVVSPTIVEVNAPVSRLRKGLVHVSRLKAYLGSTRPEDLTSERGRSQASAGGNLS